MPRHPDSGRIDLKKIFRQVQQEMLSRLAVRDVLEHATTSGAATERQWIELFNAYLPRRYQASSAFVVDADGKRSRQIDIAIYDRFYSPLLFSHEAGQHVPAESVYAVFEVKQVLTRQWVRDAGIKVGSARRLRRTSAAVPHAGGRYRGRPPGRILGGILAQSSVWSDGSFHRMLPAALGQLKGDATMDFGCVLEDGAFETMVERGGRQTVRLSTPGEALIFFMIRLIERLRECGSAPAVDLMEYGRGLESFGRE